MLKIIWSQPDAKIYFKNEKKIVVIEMSVLWIENRESKLTEKIDKYKHVIAKLKCENHGFVVQQATIIIDCLGGFSPSLKNNLKSLNFTTSVINNIIFNMQKVTVSEASAIIHKFKYMTSEYFFCILILFIRVLHYLTLSKCVCLFLMLPQSDIITESLQEYIIRIITSSFLYHPSFTKINLV